MGAGKLPVPDNQTIGIATTSLLDDKFFLAQTGFLTPSSVLLGNAADGSLKPGKTQKALFDASRDVVEQLEATSKDGTKVPYFIVHRKDIPMDGSTPTLLTAYGGFQVSNTPYLQRSDGQAVAGARRQFCAGEYSRRRRVRAGVARSRIEDAQAADL